MIRSTSIHMHAPGLYRVGVGGWIERRSKNGRRCLWEITVPGFGGANIHESFDACQAALIVAGVIAADVQKKRLPR